MGFLKADFPLDWTLITFSAVGLECQQRASICSYETSKPGNCYRGQIRFLARCHLSIDAFLDHLG